MHIVKSKLKRTASDASLTEEYSNHNPERVPREVYIVSQEVQIVKALACNDVNKRNRQLRKLSKWLQLRSRSSFQFTEDDFMRIWKGLYYNMWMSDKPLVQEELAQKLSQLMDCFNDNVDYSIEFFNAFIKTLVQEWFGIDQWRIDKFLMLVRRMLRSILIILKKTGWSSDAIDKFNSLIAKTLFSKTTQARGLTMHYFDIFFEELAKASEGKMSKEQVNLFLLPFVTYIGTQNDGKLVAQCRTRVLYHLLYQTSLGREYTEKYNAWKELGFPSASIDDLEKNEDETLPDDAGDELLDTKPTSLDPRAGGVDVYMPELPLDANCVIEEIERLLRTQDYNSKKRKALRKLLCTFETYKRGEFPLGIKTVPRVELPPMDKEIDKKVEQLENLENNIYHIGRKLKLLNKRKRRKLLKSISFADVNEENYEKVFAKVLSKKPAMIKKKKIARYAAMNVWKEEVLDANTAPKDVLKPVNSDVKSATAKTNKKISEKVKQPQNKEKTASECFQETSKPNNSKSDWEQPLKKGEIEYYTPSRKVRLLQANNKIVVNPLAIKHAAMASTKKAILSEPNTPASNSRKRVKIALKHNTSQKPSDYIKQIRSSPQLPYDADKKPGKGLLKPNTIPSPINPFYKKKIGLKLFNDTL